jgi:hypothetical protein
MPPWHGICIDTCCAGRSPSLANQSGTVVAKGKRLPPQLGAAPATACTKSSRYRADGPLDHFERWVFQSKHMLTNWLVWNELSAKWEKFGIHTEVVLKHPAAT